MELLDIVQISYHWQSGCGGIQGGGIST